MAEPGFFDNTLTASSYSQLTGVLSGFAFAGLLLVLTVRHDAGRRDLRRETALARSLTLLLGATLGLGMSSLSYAVMAGETGAQPRAAVEHALAGVGFVAAALLLLLATVELISSVPRSAFPEVEAVLRTDVGRVSHLVGRWVPLVAMVYVAMAGLDVASPSTVAWRPLTLASLGFPLALVVLVVVRTRRAPRPRVVRDTWAVTLLALLAVLASSVSVALLSTFADPQAPAEWPAWLALVVAFGFLTAFNGYGEWNAEQLFVIDLDAEDDFAHQADGAPLDAPRRDPAAD